MATAIGLTNRVHLGNGVFMQRITGLPPSHSIASVEEPVQMRVGSSSILSEWPKSCSIIEGSAAFANLDAFIESLLLRLGMAHPPVKVIDRTCPYSRPYYTLRIKEDTPIDVLDATTNERVPYNAHLKPSSHITCVPTISPPYLWHRHRNSGWCINIARLLIIINEPVHRGVNARALMERPAIGLLFAPEVECVVCMDRPPNVKFNRSCRHVCCCQACVADIDRCPVCREPFSEYTVVVRSPAALGIITINIV